MVWLSTCPHPNCLRSYFLFSKFNLLPFIRYALYVLTSNTNIYGKKVLMLSIWLMWIKLGSSLSPTAFNEMFFLQLPFVLTCSRWRVLLVLVSFSIFKEVGFLIFPRQDAINWKLNVMPRCGGSFRVCQAWATSFVNPSLVFLISPVVLSIKEIH